MVLLLTAKTGKELDLGRIKTRVTKVILGKKANTTVSKMLLSDDVLCQIMSMAENVEYQLLSCFHQNHNFLLQFFKSINIVGNAN
jgi:hypothetical protein